MPELPEVTIMVNGLKKRVFNKTIIKIWTDAEKLIKNLKFEEFKKEIKGRKIIDVFRKGKVVCFQLDNNKILFVRSSVKRKAKEEVYLFVHPKMSGHFLVGKWKLIGNTWQSFRITNTLTKQEIKKVYQAIKPILEKAIKLGGSSVSDFYNSEGNKGNFQNEFKIYRRNGQKCFNCLTIIKREKLANRSTHFCPKCQK